jgi:abequosyltransferase
MNAIRLSICIPIYNFGAFIGETLDSIIPQASNEVEIVVVDGASTDDTPEVIHGFQRKFPRLNYVRLPQKGGIDRDMAKTVEFAQGEYCWLFGGDDIMRDGSIQRVLAELKSSCDVYLCESILCTKDMTPIMKHNILNTKTERIFNLSNDVDRRAYFSLANNSAAFFSFCGALIIRKSRWDPIHIDDSFYSTCWAHAARIFGMMKVGLVIKYLPEPLLFKRGENDSFMDKGLVHRCGIAINGYTKIADTYFGHNSSEAFHIRRVLRNELPLGAFLSVKIRVASSGELRQREILDNLALKLHSERSIFNRLGFIIYRYTPVYLLRFIKLLLDTYKRIRAAIKKLLI